MLDRLTGMQVFSRVAALGSLSAAARSLGLSPTMVTKHVAALEERLGVKLLHRTTRRLTLTEAGRRFLDSAERIIAEVEEAEAAAASERVDVRGSLRLNVPVSFGVREIAPLLPDFSATYPLLVVELGLNDRVVDLIEEGWDMAIRVGRLATSSLIARKLAPCSTVICASPAYLARRGTPRRIADLAQHDCLGYTLSQSVGRGVWSFGVEGEATVRVNGTLYANNGDALVAAAIAGQGVIYQPRFLVRDALRTGQLVALELDHPTVDLPGVFALYPPDRRPPAKVRAFIDFLVTRFGPVPRWERDRAA